MKPSRLDLEPIAAIGRTHLDRSGLIVLVVIVVRVCLCCGTSAVSQVQLFSHVSLSLGYFQSLLRAQLLFVEVSVRLERLGNTSGTEGALTSA